MADESIVEMILWYFLMQIEIFVASYPHRHNDYIFFTNVSVIRTSIIFLSGPMARQYIMIASNWWPDIKMIIDIYPVRYS